VEPLRTGKCDLERAASEVIGLWCAASNVYWHSMRIVIPPTTPLRDDDGARVSEASRAKRHAATSQVQYLTDHIRFVTHLGKQILLIDLSNCSAAEVEKIFRAVPEFVTTRPRDSVLILSDFRGAPIDQEAIRIMKETAVFDKPYVKKSAWIGGENLPQGFSENLGNFSRREFPIFETREEALAWLAKDGILSLSTTLNTGWNEKGQQKEELEKRF